MSTAYAHEDEVAGSVRAAERIVPFLLQTIGRVRSVVDLGGGTGAWLRAFQSNGVSDVLLIDVPEVEPGLLIDRKRFQPANLDAAFPETARFDLAVCVECAEHLSPDRGPPLVEWLTGVADCVVFSAAIPGQGGKGHRNLRVPSYWSELFRQRGFVRRDVLRRSLVGDMSVPWWYRQNLVLYTKLHVAINSIETDYVPEEFLLAHETVAISFAQNHGFKDLLRLLRPALVSAIRRRLV